MPGDAALSRELKSLQEEISASRKERAAASAAAEMASAPASAAASDPLATTQAKLQALKAQSASSLAAIDQLKLPFGWPQGFELCALLSVSKLLGCLMTALAVALGAPFWFDTLQKFLNLRAAGPKPAKA